MSRYGSHTHRAASVAHPFLRAFRKGVLGALLLLLPIVGYAQTCRVTATSPTFTRASPNQPASFTFTIARTSPTGPACTNINGTVTQTAGMADILSVNGDTTAPFNYTASEGQTVTIAMQSHTTGDNTSITADCLASASCVGASSTSAFFTLQTVVRDLQVISGDGNSGDTGTTIQLSARALDNGAPTFTPVTINWTLTSGPASPPSPASSSSSMYGDATTLVTLGTGSAGNNTVIVTASRADDPTVTAQFTLTVNYYDFRTVSPAQGSTVVAGLTYPLVVEYLRNGVPQSDTGISWSLLQGPPGTSLEPPFNITNLQGQATSNLTVGAPNPGTPPASIIVQATVGGGAALAKGLVTPPLQATFTLTPLDVITLSATSGGGQSADVGDPLANPLVVAATRNGAPDTLGTINWSVSPANAVTFSATSTPTDASGNAQVTVTSVNAAGPFTVTATHASDTAQTATFSGTGIAPTLTLGSASGDNQSAPVNQPIPQPLSIQALSNGAGQGGVTINWTVTPANFATLSATSTTTDSISNNPGFTSITVTNGATGGAYTVTATRADNPAVSYSFNLVALQRDLVKPTDSGDGQSAATNTALPNPLVVVSTLNGSTEPSVPISWSVVSGSATLSNATTPTDANGRSSVTVTLGGTAGPVVVRATRGDDTTIFEDYTVNAVTRDLVKPTDSGNGQAGATGSTLPSPLVVVATLNGTAQSAVPITWSVVSGGATLTNATSPTDGSGRSSVTVTLGASPGPAVIRATRGDDSTVVEDYTVTGFTKALVKPTTGSGDNQTGVVNTTLPQPLVAVATLNGNPEGGVTVNWTVQSGSATLSNVTNPTDNAGRSTASVTFGATAGPVVVRATRADVPTQFQDYTLTAVDVRTLDKPTTGSGDGQSGNVGTELPQPLVVIARNNGQPAAGVQVTWSATNGATIVPSTSTTDATGRAEVQVRFGATPGSVTVTATRADAPTATASFVLTATSPTVPPPTLTLEKPADSGDGATLAPGEGTTLTVVALSNGVPDANVPVFWQLVSGSGMIGTDQAISGSDGRASTTFIAGATPGPVTVRAVHGQSDSSQLFRLTVAGTAPGARLEIVSGDGQVAAPGSRGEALVVRLSDNGVPVPSANVTWEVVQGNATLDTATNSTGNDGTASNGIVFGAAIGEVFVRATSNGSSATFRFRTAEPGARVLRLISGDGQRGPVGTRADLPFVVEVVDGTGTAVSGQVIQWTVVSGSATLDAATSSTDGLGRASVGFRFGPVAGPVRLRGAIGTPTNLQFVTIDATSFQPTLAIVSGNNQTAPAGTLLPQDLVVQIAAPPASKTLAGVTVRWEVVDGGGTLASATSLTDASGRASNKFTLGPAGGTQRVRASLEGGASVTFTENAVATPGALAIVSGNNQTLPTRTPSAPLVVSLSSTTGQPLPGAVLLWSGTNAEVANARTTTDAQGRATNIAEVVLPGVSRVTVSIEGVPNSATVVFLLNGGVSNVPSLGQPEETVANAIDNLCPALVALSNPTPAQADLRARCLELVNNAGDHPDQVDNALDEMRQDVALAQANAAFNAARTQFDNVKTRIAALRSGSSGADFNGLAIANSSGVMPLSFLPSSVVQEEDEAEGGGSMEGQEIGSDFSRWGFFASGIIGRGSYDGSSVTPEYDYDTNGLTAGVDYRINDQWVAGASVGWNQQDTDLAADAGGVETSGWSISGYTTWFNANNWYVDGVLTFGSNDYDLERAIRYGIVGANGTTTQVDQVARASTGGDQLAMAFSFGRDFQRGSLSFGPYVRGMYTRVDFDAYSEELAAGTGSGLGLAVESRELTSMTGVVGGKMTWALSRDWGILMPHAQVEWEHEFEDDPQQLVARFLHDPTNTSIRVEGDEVDTDFFNIGIGLSALFANGRSAFLYYEHLAGSEGLSQDNLSLGVRIEF